MLFNSLSFAIFLTVVFVLYWCLPHRYRWALLIASGLYFYFSWSAWYTLLLVGITLLSYGAALWLEKADSVRKKRWILALGVILCLGALVFFKYFNFLTASVSALLRLVTVQWSPLTLKLMLPIGISFFTFQTVGYLVDVYRGKIAAERHFGYYAAFVCFFPQLLSGPIPRANDLLPQLKAERSFNYDTAAYGLKQMLWGFFKKLVIADTLSVYVNTVYDAPDGFTGFSLVLATLFFAVQIYCDFSGYSDIAIGIAKLFGLELATNFKSPYFAQSVKEFWGRWHISLSTWFRDYIYIPLGGNRVGKARHIFNLMVTFLVSGLWHGANLTFIVWGAIHGAAQALESLIIPKEKLKSTGVVRWLRVLAVFLFASFAWIFFVSASLSDAGYVIGHLFSGLAHPLGYLRAGFSAIGMKPVTLAVEAVMILILAVVDYFSLKVDVIREIGRKKTFVRWALYVALALIVVFFSQKGIAASFVYFQF